MSWPYPMHSRLNPADSDKHYNITSPLLADGTDFSCKGYLKNADWNPTADYIAGQVYDMTLAGAAPTLATHGGGSCQISLSYDNGLSFHVIKSIIGSCPLALNYTFTIPPSAPNSKAILAWSWQNHVGNREFYMNCAQVNCAQVETSGGKGSNFNSLPYIWKANLQGINDCRTIEDIDPVYPNPGQDVEYGVRLSESSPPSPGVCDSVAGQPSEPSGDRALAVREFPVSIPPCEDASCGRW